MADLFTRHQEFQKVADEGVWMIVRDPNTDAPFGEAEDRIARIKLLGAHSAEIQRYNKVRGRQFLARYQKRGEMDIPPEELEKYVVDMMVHATVEWENIDWQGQVNISLSPKTARDIYTKVSWLRQQAFEFIRDMVNYDKNYVPTGDDAPVDVNDPLDVFRDAEKKVSDGSSGGPDSSSPLQMEATTSPA